ncbi:hypothetical protein ACN9MB_13695 [Dyella kyungheensis]|jgi:hypothetical protein|uniref:hypothetical protein n=1 Tax=Dyella kyungheensis TaxID=1242174 RepID=UPI003CE7626F
MPIFIPNAAPPAIVLLETIGQSASLRHASKSDLAQALEKLGASERLKLALTSEDSAPLQQELGYPEGIHVNHNTGVWDGDA